MHVSHKKSKIKGGEGTKCEIHRLEKWLSVSIQAHQICSSLEVSFGLEFTYRWSATQKTRISVLPSLQLPVYCVCCTVLMLTLSTPEQPIGARVQIRREFLRNWIRTWWTNLYWDMVCTISILCCLSSDSIVGTSTGWRGEKKKERKGQQWEPVKCFWLRCNFM